MFVTIEIEASTLQALRAAMGPLGKCLRAQTGKTGELPGPGHADGALWEFIPGRGAPKCYEGPDPAVPVNTERTEAPEPEAVDREAERKAELDARAPKPDPPASAEGGEPSKAAYTGPPDGAPPAPASNGTPPVEPAAASPTGEETPAEAATAPESETAPPATESTPTGDGAQ